MGLTGEDGAIALASGPTLSDGIDPYPSLAQKIARYASCLAMNRLFVHGNKCVAAAAWFFFGLRWVFIFGTRTRVLFCEDDPRLQSLVGIGGVDAFACALGEVFGYGQPQAARVAAGLYGVATVEKPADRYGVEFARRVLEHDATVHVHENP